MKSSPSKKNATEKTMIAMESSTTTSSLVHAQQAKKAAPQPPQERTNAWVAAKLVNRSVNKEPGHPAQVKSNPQPKKYAAIAKTTTATERSMTTVCAKMATHEVATPAPKKQKAVEFVQKESKPARTTVGVLALAKEHHSPKFATAKMTTVTAKWITSQRPVRYLGKKVAAH